MDERLFIEHSPLGYSVCCYKSDWEQHILGKSGHSIMKNNLESVRITIAKPEFIFASNQWENRDIYFKRCSSATYGGKLYTKVVVQKPDIHDEYGYVVSAWPQPNIKGNIDEGGLLYAKSKL